MGDLESLMGQTKALMGELITKPKMSDKLLGKPPFRFLHDTITSVISTTGFGEGLYEGGELDSASITDKDAKINYLNKIFNLVGICKGYPIDIRAAKVVAGLEPENTNIFLIALAECASDRNLDNEQAVRRTLQGEEPGQGAKPTRGGGASSVAESKFEEPVQHSRHSDESKGSHRDNGGAKELEAKIPAEMEMIAPERGKSRGGTRGGKPNNAAPDSGLGGGMGASFAPKLDKEIERCDGSDTTTMQLLGDVITRPKLTEKLLSKPPFRFLHDVIMEVVRSTGFATGLYTAEETDSANVADKNQKILFLEKIIKVVGLQLNTLVVANPSKIVAGREPQDTNNFLQLLAVAVKNLPDSSSAVRTVLEGIEGGGASGGGESAPAQSVGKPSHSPQEDKAELSPPHRQQAPAPQQPERETFQPAPSTKNRDMMQADEKLNLDTGGGEEEEEGDGDKRSTRPTTARRRPPKVKDGAKELQSKDVAPAAKKTEGIIIDGQADDDDIEDEVVEDTRLADDLGGGAEAKGSAGGNEPQSKLVKDIMSRQVEQEASRATKVEAAEESKETSDVAGGSGIRLGRRKMTGTDKKGAAGGGVVMGENDLEKMRSSIQVLVQHTGPLGTCMDYIQEDVSLMTAELHRWEEECRKYEVEYEEAKRKTKETLHPLKLELAEINDYIFEAIAKISSAKATNAHNDEKIQQILKLSATA